MQKNILFEQLKPDVLKQIIDSSGIIYLPLGTLEWHQLHLPFGLDAAVSYYLCKEACRKTGGCVIPPLYFGTDQEHEVNGKVFHGMDAKMGKILPGSIYFLNSDIFYQILRSIAVNVSEQGFGTLVIVSAHSGSKQQEVIERLAHENINNLDIIAFPGKKFVGGIDHAGRIETSMMLAIDEKLVNIGKLKENYKPYEAMSGDDPLLASDKEGKERLEKVINQIILIISQRSNT